jgi:hypothetical protein
MWLDSSVRRLVHGQVPKGLESKTTLVIQVLDLGFIMLVGFLSGIMVGFPILTLIGIGMTIVLLRNVSDAATLQVAHA